MKYAVFNTEGQIVQEGNCPASVVTKQGLKGYTSVEVAGDVTAVTHRINPNTGKAVKKSVAEVAAKRAELKALDDVKPGKTKIERILAHLKKQGIDLGPAGADL